MIQPSEKSVWLAQSGRFLLAVGVPTLFAGAVVAETSYADCDYYDASDEKRWGWALFGVGAAASATGIATLIRATTEARRAAKIGKSRIMLGLTTTLASLAAFAVGIGGSSGNLMCTSGRTHANGRLRTEPASALVAGTRYAQRLPVEFRVPMGAAIAF